MYFRGGPKATRVRWTEEASTGSAAGWVQSTVVTKIAIAFPVDWLPFPAGANFLGPA
jgi:hypothetical protein